MNEFEKLWAEGKGRKYPKTIAAKWETSDSPYLATFEEVEDAIEIDGVSYIAVYELKTVKRCRLIPEVR